VRKLRFGALFLLALLFPGNTAAEANLLAAGAAQGAYGNSSEVPGLTVQDVCSPNWSRRNTGPRLLFTILFPWSAIFGFGPSANAGASPGAYEDTVEGLGRLVVDICAAKRAQNDAALDKLLNGLILPNHEAWMVATFGEGMGERMAATYSERRGGLPALLSSGFSTLIEGGAMNAEISSSIASSGVPFRVRGKGRERDNFFVPDRATRFYYVWISSADPTNTKNQGGLFFVYVNGGFRYLESLRPAPAPSAPAETLAATAPIIENPGGGVAGGVYGGVLGGVQGGIPGGVVGGVIRRNATIPREIEMPSASEPPTPKAPPLRIRASASVMQGKLIHKVDPVYPSIARQAHASGVVILEVTVAKDGSVRTVRAVSGHPLLQYSAVAAVKQWKYQPTMLGGEPVEVVTTVTINFRLETKPPE
jgi:TonB family protein